MKLIKDTSNNIPTNVIIILFITFGILLTLLPKFIYAQTIENELIEKTLEQVEKATDDKNTLETVEKATPNSIEITEPFQLENITNNLNNNTESVLAGPGQTTEEEIKSMDNASDLSTTEDQDIVGSSTLEEQFKLAQERLNQLGLGTFNTSKLDIELGFPTVDFSKMLEDAVGLFIDVEYQSASAVVLRAEEETLLLLNGTLAPFWYAIDIVTNHGYQLKEITESGMGSQGNPTRFYAILEKDRKTQQTTTTNHNNTGIEKKIANETSLVQNNTNNKDSLETTSTLDQKQLQLQQQQQQQQTKENTTTSTDVLPESKILQILSHNSYIDPAGTMHVVGEVENNTPKVAQFVEIIGTFYDSNNKVVGTSSTFTSPTDLISGEIAPFDLMLSDASIPIEQIERYNLKVSGQ